MVTEEVLARIPTDAGVYLFKDADGEVVYVGKAQSLRTRVRQYFREGGDERFFVAAGFLARTATDVETIVVSSAKEALLLENHLIKKHQPKFNVKLRDDKQYLVLRLLDPAPAEDAKDKRHLFPRVEVACRRCWPVNCRSRTSRRRWISRWSRSPPVAPSSRARRS